MSFTFSPDIWTDFDAKTGSGRAPFLFESILPLQEGFAGPDAVAAGFFALQDTSVRERVDCRVRVYVGEDRRDDLVEHVLSQNIADGEDLMQFMKRCTGHDRFSLVLNNFEQASSRTAADFGQFLRSFFAARGCPLGGTEQAVFSGNYSGTAFGIHEGFEHAFLCHLGPGHKNFYCWSREVYTGITGTRAPTFSDSPHFDELMKLGELFVLKPGDALYLPAAVYHIGRQEDYSVSVALPLYTYPLTRFLSRGVIPPLADSSLPFDQEGMSPLLSFKDENPLVNPVEELLRATVASWTKTDLPRFLAYYWHRLRSNGGWELPRVAAEDIFSESRLSEPSNVEKGCVFRLRPPLLLTHQAGLDCASDQIRVFCGAHSIVLSGWKPDFPAMSDKLNRGEEVTADTIPIAAMVRELSRTGGIELV